jgi:hypothetical protein
MSRNRVRIFLCKEKITNSAKILPHLVQFFENYRSSTNFEAIFSTAKITRYFRQRMGFGPIFLQTHPVTLPSNLAAATMGL